MQKIVIFDMFISGKNGTSECMKCSIVPSLSISIVQASSRDGINSFPPPDRRGGGAQCTQLQLHEPPGRSGSGVQTRDSQRFRNLCKKRDLKAHPEKGSRLKGTIGFRGEMINHCSL